MNFAVSSFRQLECLVRTHAVKYLFEKTSSKI
jgi:hypothetical protein